MPSPPPRARAVRDPHRGLVGLGSIGGTQLRVAPSCALVVALIAVAFAPRARALVPDLDAGVWVVGIAVGISVYAAALLHEAAHAVVARRHGHTVPTIVLTAAGGRTTVSGESAGPREEASTAAAGPVVSLLLGALALGVRAGVEGGVAALVLEALVVANLLIGLVDLVPTPPLDGGRLVRALAWRATGSRARGGLVAALTGRATGVVLVLVPVTAALWGAPVTLSVWVVCLGLAGLAWAASTAELSFHRLRVGVEGRPLADLARALPDDVATLHALRAFPVLPGAARADGVLAELVRRPGQDHLVVDDTGAARGVVSLADLERAARAARDARR